MPAHAGVAGMNEWLTHTSRREVLLKRKAMNLSVNAALTQIKRVDTTSTSVCFRSYVSVFGREIGQPTATIRSIASRDRAAMSVGTSTGYTSSRNAR